MTTLWRLQLLVGLHDTLLHNFAQVGILHRSCYSLFVIDLLVDCKTSHEKLSQKQFAV